MREEDDSGRPVAWKSVEQAEHPQGDAVAAAGFEAGHGEVGVGEVRDLVEGFAAAAPPEHLFLCGVIVSDATSGDDRCLSRTVLADRAWSTPDATGNTGTHTLVLRPLRIALP